MRATRIRRIVLWAGGAVALFALVGFVVAPLIVRSQLERIAGEQLGRTVTVEQVRINPFALSASVHNFSLKEQDGSTIAASFEELYLNVALSSLFRLAPIIEAVRLSKPFVRVVRNDDKSYNFQDIIDRFSGAPAAPPAPAGPPPAFAVYNIEIADGRIELDDRPEKTQHTVTDLRIGVPFVSSLSSQVAIKVQPLLSAKVNGTPFELAGETAPFTDTGESTVRVDIDDLQLAKYLEYSPVPLRIRVPSGRLDTKLTLSVSMVKGRLQTLALSGSASLQDLKIQQANGAPLFALRQLSVELDSMDLLGQRAVIKSVRIEAPEVDVTRFKDGSLNLLAVIPASPAAVPAPSSGPPFMFSVGEIALAKGRVGFVDQSPEKPARIALRNLSLNLRGLGNAPGTKAAVKFSADTEAKGRLAYQGSLQIAPLNTEGQLELARLRLGVLAPYIEQVLNVVVADGTFSTKGRLFVEVPDGRPLRLAYRGDASVPNFAVLEKASSQELLRWKSLAVNGIEVEIAPLKVVVAEIALADFYSRLILSADGKLNLQALVRESDPGTPPPATPAVAGTRPDIRLGKVVLSGGSVSYSDFLVTPNYSVMLTGVGGSVTAITPEQPGEVELHARIHQTAPVDIAGRLNPLAKDLFVDLKVSARDIDLSPLTPYSVKYAGYGIEKGRLSVKLAYRIENGKMVAENNIYLDQLTFGEKVGSATATHLPVQLAVALLKDKNGVIDVNVPISGSLDSPEFNVGSVLGQVFGNLISKTVSSPFAALGSLVGGGEELSFLEFPAGSASLAAGNEAKLTSLAKALDGRPGLKLEVRGRGDPAADRDALKRAGLERQVEAAKLKAGGELSAPELEKVMLAEVPVSDGELRLLANARAQAAKDWLVESGKIAPERIFISTPSLGSEGIKDRGKPTRVDFSLR